MFNRSAVPQFGLRLGARVYFSRVETQHAGDSYIQHAVRDAAIGVIDDIVRRFKKEVQSDNGKLVGVEYRLDVVVMTQDDIDELFGQAYHAGIQDGAKWGPFAATKAPA